MREKETSTFLYFNFILFGFWIMVLEQAALTHDIERIFRSKRISMEVLGCGKKVLGVLTAKTTIERF